MPLSIGEGGSLAWQRLAVVNAHPRDARIQFNEEEHSYAIDGSKEGWVSCTHFFIISLDILMPMLLLRR